KLEALDGKVSLDENAEFRHEDHAQFEDKEAADPLEAKAKAKGLNYVKLDGAVGIIGNGAGLVMSTLDVVAYAGEAHQVDGQGVKPANFLDIGGGASAQVMANGLEIILGDPDVKSVFVNVFGGITACDEVANGIIQALALLGERGEQDSQALVVPLDGYRDAACRAMSGGTATTPRPAARSCTAPTTRWSSGWTRWTVRPSAPPSSRLRGSDVMAIWLTQDSKVIVQGITGSEGSKHTKRMLAAGTNVVGGVNPRKAGTTVDFDGTSLPVFASVGEAMKETGADVSVIFVPPAFTKGAVLEAIDAEIPLAVVITEGVPVQDSAAFWAHNIAQGQKTQIIGPNCPGIA